eukprot:409912-Ditylum_brightwellii.AAC.1
MKLTQWHKKKEEQTEDKEDVRETDLYTYQGRESYTVKEYDSDNDSYEEFHSFAPVDMTHVTVHLSVKEIGNSAFLNYKKLESITIPEEAEVVGEYAFYGCYELSIVELPTTIKEIKYDAFSQ